MKSAIEIINLAYEYSNNVNTERKFLLMLKKFSIEKGKLTCITGVNGSGKSTLMGLLGVLRKPNRAVVEGQPTTFSYSTEYFQDSRIKSRIEEFNQIFASAEGLRLGQKLSLQQDKTISILHRYCIGFMLQSSPLIDTLTIQKNIELPMMLAKVPREKMKTRVKYLLELFELQDYRNKLPQVSGGQQQRVALCRALAHNPPILLVDEPTSAIDRETTQKIIGILKKYVQEEGKTVVIITHDRTLIQEELYSKEARDFLVHYEMENSESREFERVSIPKRLFPPSPETIENTNTQEGFEVPARNDEGVTKQERKPIEENSSTGLQNHQNTQANVSTEKTIQKLLEEVQGIKDAQESMSAAIISEVTDQLQRYQNSQEATTAQQADQKLLEEVQGIKDAQDSMSTAIISKVTDQLQRYQNSQEATTAQQADQKLLEEVQGIKDAQDSMSAAIISEVTDQLQRYQNSQEATTAQQADQKLLEEVQAIKDAQESMSAAIISEVTDQLQRYQNSQEATIVQQADQKLLEEVQGIKDAQESMSAAIISEVTDQLQRYQNSQEATTVQQADQKLLEEVQGIKDAQDSMSAAIAQQADQKLLETFEATKKEYREHYYFTLKATFLYEVEKELPNYKVLQAIEEKWNKICRSSNQVEYLHELALVRKTIGALFDDDEKIGSMYLESAKSCWEKIRGALSKIKQDEKYFYWSAKYHYHLAEIAQLEKNNGVAAKHIEEAKKFSSNIQSSKLKYDLSTCIDDLGNSGK